MADSAAEKTAPAVAEAPKMLFGAPVASGAASTGPAFSGTTVRPFGAPDAGAPSTEAAAEGDGEDCSDPNFRPLVSNLQRVEAKEIADDEEKIFTKRSKAYRFFKDTNEWKERCVGDINLIKNTKTGRVRIEMRMEKTQRIQINHYLYADTKISPGSNSTRMLVWSALSDTSFEEDHKPINVTLAARFQDDEGAAAFKKAFEQAVQELADAEAKSDDKSDDKATEKADKAEDKADDKAEDAEKKPAESDKTEKSEADDKAKDESK